jgi:hypothetical protein
MSFGASSFAETSFAEEGGTSVIGTPGRFVIFPLNVDTMKTPIRINRLADFNIDLNTTQDHSVKINKTIEYNLRR